MVTGQEKICNRIASLTIDSFPRSLMLVGPRGSGKHLLCTEIAQKFKLLTRDITKELTLENIEEMYNRVEPYLYVISINSISVKEENTILKFLEEPLKNAFIVLIAETDNGILQTILNRCQIWYLQPYKKEFLSTFLTNSNERILLIADTPGQVQELTAINLDEAVGLADKLITKIHMASVSNTLTLVSKVGFKETDNKINIQLFVKILLYRFLELSKSTNNNLLVRGYSLTSELSKNLNIKNLDQKLLFEKYLIELRSCMRGEAK